MATLHQPRQVYGWFALLSLSTFPLTPLLLPLIDKRRPEGAQGPG